MELEGYKRLCILLFVIIGVSIIVFGTNKYADYKENKAIELNQTMRESFNSGVQYGYLVAITNVMSNSQNCNIVPLSYNNITINMIDVNCMG